MRKTPLRFLILAFMSGTVFTNSAQAVETCRDAFANAVIPVHEIEAPRTISIPFNNEKGRAISIEIALPSIPGQPLFLFLPGVNRSGRLADASSVELIKKGFGVAQMDFSVQPFSVATLESGTSPYFRRRNPKLEDLAQEVDYVIAELRKRYGTENIIPVSLSYSGSVSPLLQAQALVIETVPMTSERIVNAKGAAFRDQLRAGEIFNPIFGPGISRNLIDQAYRANWAPQVDTLVDKFNLPKEKKADYTEGYIALSRASEDATWQGKSMTNAARRVFILAEGESQPLLLDQLQTVQRLLNENKNVSLVLVEGSGHIIPVEKPDVYVKALEGIVTGQTPSSQGITRLLNNGTVESFAAGREAQLFLETAINAIKSRR